VGVQQIDNVSLSDSDEGLGGHCPLYAIFRTMTQHEDMALLIEELQLALVKRDVQRGFKLLDEALANLSTMKCDARHSSALLLSLAQWTDLGYRDLPFLDALFAQCPPGDRGQLSVLAFFETRLAEAYRDLASERLESCIEGIDLVLRVGEGLFSNYFLFVANLWKCRAHRKRGEYQHALVHIIAAKEAAERLGAPKLVAVTKIHEGWLAFQNGQVQFALQLLDEAEVELQPTGHALSLGNIESARGRFVRRSGQYARAIRHFQNAIDIYRSGYPEHPNLARALVNAAYVKRLMALDMHPNKAGKQASGATHAKIVSVRREALTLLAQAETIYARHEHQGGTGSVLVNAAHLHLENGDIGQASVEGNRAFDLGEQKNDQILMARARNVQAMVELELSEEQLGEEPDVALHAHLAVQYSETSIALALQTQNKRLLAEAYITRGMIAASDFHQDLEPAREYATKATTLLSSNDRDHLFNSLGTLKRKLVDATRVDENLRMWSDGQLGNKSFQQVQEEFAELVIPKVWLSLDKNISAVAKRLSISPKKVRRILRNANLLSE